MSRFFLIHCCLGLFAIAGVGLWQGFGLEWRGFAYGIGVFSVNIGLLILLVKWLFGVIEGVPDSGGAVSEGKGQVKKFVIMGALVVVKLGFVGATVYFGLVVWDLPLLYFIGGGLFGLLTAAIVGAKIQKRIIAQAGAVS